MLFDSLKESLEASAAVRSDQYGNPTTFDLQAATTVLLMRLGIIDEHFQVWERAAIQRLLVRHFELSDEDSAHLIEVAEFLNRSGQSLDSFGALLQDRFTSGQRLTVLAMLWKVILADGVVNSFEAKTAQEITGLVGLEEPHLVRAKEIAQEGGV